MAVPVATSQNQTVVADYPTVVQLQGNDPDGTPLAFAISTPPAHGTITGLNATSGACVYTPNAGYTGGDTFQFTVTSNSETSTPATVTLAVTGALTKIKDQLPASAIGGSVIFELTTAAQSNGGIVPTSARVVSVVDSSGYFEVQVIPSNGLSPQQYYQVWLREASTLRRELLGVFEVPASNNVLTLADCVKVSDIGVASRYSFVSMAGFQALIGSLVQQLGFSLGVLSRTTNRLQKWSGSTVADSSIEDQTSQVKITKPVMVMGTIQDDSIKQFEPGGDIVAGFVDQDGKIALGVRQSGDLVGALSDKQIKEINDGVDGKVFGVCDQNGNLAFSVDAAGYLHGLDVPDEGTAASICFDGSGNAYFAKRLQGIWQIYKLAGSTLTRLTSVDENFAPTVNGSYLYYARKLATGAIQYRRLDLNTLTDTLFAANWVAQADWHHLLITGQSLSKGYSSSPPLSTVQPYSNLKFNGGVNPGGSGGNLASLVPLVEDAGVETIASGTANSLVAGNNEGQAMIVSGHGENGYNYNQIKKTTTPYANGMAQVTAAKNLATAAGKSYRVDAVHLIHGEADHQGSNASYGTNLATLQNDYETDCKAITGQTGNIPLLLCQMNSWTWYGQTTSIIPGQQLAAHEAGAGKVVLVTPKYFLPYSDGLHLTNIGERWLAEYHAKALQVILGGGTWEPLRPLSLSRSGAEITITFNVPVGSLVLDTALVANPGNYGFEYTDGSGSPPIINGVAIVGTNQIKITLASTPTGSNKKVRYAMTGVASAWAGPQTGARGCLRDQDTTASAYGNTLYNWCVAFEKTVS